MAKFDYVQTNFTRGELSPRLQGRIDFQGFFNGVEALQNMIALPFGGVTKRPGTRFVAEVKDQNRPARLIPFEFSTQESYALVLNDDVMRFFLNEGQLITNDIGNTSITNGDFTNNRNGWNDNSTGSASISHASGGFLNFQGGSSGDTAIAEQDISIDNNGVRHTLSFQVLVGSDRPGTIMRVKVGSSSGSGDLKDIDVVPGTHVIEFDPVGNSTVYLQYEYSGTRTIRLDDVRFQNNQQLELNHPWTDSDLFDIKWVQSADVVWLVQIDTWPRQLKRFSETEFSLELFDFVDGPYDEVNDTSTTLTPNSTSGKAVEINASSQVGINEDKGFDSTDEGRWIRLKQNGKWGAGQIVGVSNNTKVLVDVRDKEFENTNATENWRLGSWSPRDGFPSVTTFHDQRLVFGATSKEPQALWFSRTGDFPNFQPTDRDGDVKDDDGVNITISSSQVNAIRWIESLSSGLAVGTSGAEFLVRSATTTDPLGPNSIEAQRNTNRGSAPAILPAKVGNSIMFVQRGARTLRELAFDFDIDGLKARDFSLVSDHLLRPQVARIEYQQNKDSILWALRNDARLIGFTLESDQEVFAWHFHEIGGKFDGNDAFIESISVIPEGPIDQMWMVVRRDINGVPTRYVEFMEEPWLNDEKPIEDAFFVDSGLTGDFNSPTSTVSGLDHLEGQTVKVLTDGASHPDRVVENGSITLQFETTKVQVGLGYTAGFRTFPFNQGTQGDILSGKIKRIHKLHLFFFDTVGAKFGYDPNDLDIVQFRDSSMAMDQPVPPFTGTKSLNFPMRHDLDAHIIVRSDDPLPITVLQAAASMEFFSDAGD